MRDVDPHAWAFTDWVWGPTALFPGDEPAMFTPIPLESAHGVRART